jgi:hypothetical protein
MKSQLPLNKQLAKFVRVLEDNFERKLKKRFDGSTRLEISVIFREILTKALIDIIDEEDIDDANAS